MVLEHKLSSIADTSLDSSLPAFDMTRAGKPDWRLFTITPNVLLPNLTPDVGDAFWPPSWIA